MHPDVVPHSERNAQTRALKALAESGFTLADVLDPDKAKRIILAPGIGRVQFARLRGLALAAFDCA